MTAAPAIEAIGLSKSFGEVHAVQDLSFVVESGQICGLLGGRAELSSSGTTILLSSHHLAEVEQVCSHVLVVDHGTLVAGGTVADIIGTGQSVDLEVDDVARATAVLQATPRVLSVGTSD